MPPEKKKEKKKVSSKASSSGSAEGPLVPLRPSEILYTYSKVLPYFSGCGRTLEGTLAEIESGAIKASDLPAIAVIAAEMPVKGEDKKSDARDDDGWSSDEDARGKRGKGKSVSRRGGGDDKGGGGRKKNALVPQKETKFFSTNNRRLWVLKRCEALGLLGPEGTIGVRLQRPDVAKRMVEKGTRSFRVERATNEVKILDVEAPARNAPGDENPGDEKPSREETDDEDDAGPPRSRANAGDAIADADTGDASAVERLTEAVEDFHPVLRPYH
jgi:hypothetical protein